MRLTDLTHRLGRAPRAGRLRPWGRPGLIAACIALLPLGRAAELPMAALALVGVVLLMRQPHAVLSDASVRLLAALFACFWLPMWLALPDAIDPARGLETTLVFLRLLFMGICMLYWLKAPQVRERVLTLLGLVLAFWGVDACVQAIRGVNLFGQPVIEGQLTGVFHPKQTLGAVLGVLTLIFLMWLRQTAKRFPVLWLLAPLYVTAILLSGKRAAWIMLGISLLLITVWGLYALRGRRRRVAAMVGGIIVCTTAAIVSTSPHFRAKTEVTTGLASGEFQRADVATGYRLTIWQVGLQMFQDHPVNGIGPRAFRNLYPSYAGPGDFFMELNPNSGPTHPHLLVLEVAVETGSIGLLGYALVWLWLIREGVRAARARAEAYLGWLSALGIALLPINASHALYGALWSGIVFFLLIMALAHRTPSTQT